MEFVMHVNEQIFILSEGAMGCHCNRGEKENMSFRCFKKNIESDLNNFYYISCKNSKKVTRKMKLFLKIFPIALFVSEIKFDFFCCCVGSDSCEHKRELLLWVV